MSNNQALSSLIIAIVNSIARAQNTIEETQLTQILRYFKKKEGKRGMFPRRLKIALPSLRDNAEPLEHDYYCVPYINLLPHNGLRIDKAEVDFNVMFSNLQSDYVLDADEHNPPVLQSIAAENKSQTDMPEDMALSENQPSLNININGTGGWGRQKGLAASVKLTVSHHDSPEGSARMIDEIIKSAQGYMPFKQVTTPDNE